MVYFFIVFDLVTRSLNTGSGQAQRPTVATVNWKLPVCAGRCAQFFELENWSFYA